MNLEREERIIAMTKLAVLDKNYAFKDKKASDYFKHDFVYKRNFRSRFLAVLGAIIVLIFSYVHRVFINHENIMALNFKAEGIKIGAFIMLVLVLYTIISSIIANKEHAKSQQRLKMANKLMKYIDFLEEKEGEVKNYGTNVYNTRNNNQ